ncbi:hypothetical protein [Aureliella helgolandensis]|uniref:Uncharacterized protein n=1 Tax=Aureliella helgolandensis TaxID=2527968 RepID=A0A518GBD7_9BACT|nr:hypothetical protein [Aureliella helgolandensis]QDV25857.1 hypothetical protein Q31a_41850 [Aureliella helgolandensis]
MTLKHCAYCASVVLLFASAVRAEKIDMSPSQLQSTATDTVIADVVAIYDREETVGDWRYTRYVAEISIDAVDKGESLRKGQLAYVRYWNRKWIGAGQIPPSTSGHRGLPSTGDTVRIYLSRNSYDGFTKDNNDGGYNVIGANGFEIMKKESKEHR